MVKMLDVLSVLLDVRIGGVSSWRERLEEVAQVLCGGTYLPKKIVPLMEECPHYCLVSRIYQSTVMRFPDRGESLLHDCFLNMVRIQPARTGTKEFILGVTLAAFRVGPVIWSLEPERLAEDYERQLADLCYLVIADPDKNIGVATRNVLHFDSKWEGELSSAVKSFIKDPNARPSLLPTLPQRLIAEGINPGELPGGSIRRVLAEQLAYALFGANPLGEQFKLLGK